MFLGNSPVLTPPSSHRAGYSLSKTGLPQLPAPLALLRVIVCLIFPTDHLVFLWQQWAVRGHSSPCPPSEDTCHPQPHQQSATDQHFVLVNMPPVKLLICHFQSVPVAFSTLTEWLLPPSGPELLHPKEKLCTYKAVIPTTPTQ